MTTRITQNSGGMLIAAGVFIGLCFNECLASETCKNNSGSTKHVCVEWDRELAPVDGTDFEVNYACQGCSDDPAVVLMTGDDKWIVYSEVISTQVAANIGAMTTSDEENYVVKIANGANAGAANVASMVLTPSGDHSSSIGTGSRISGNLAGDLTLQETSGGSGGALALTIGGNVEGDITAATISSLTIGGELTGALETEVLEGTLIVDSVTGNGSISVTDTIESESVYSLIVGDVESGARIDIADIDGSTNLYFTGAVAGYLDLRAGLDENQIADFTSGPFSGVIDLHGSDLEGYMELPAGASGSIINGGSESASGCLWLNGSEELPFTGTVTFASAKCIKFCGSYVNGAIRITGANLGGFVGGSYLLEDGLIQIDGNVVGPGGKIHVGEDADGDIYVGGDVSSGGCIDVDGDVTSTGSSLVEGDITGDITIDGEFNGNICADNLSPMANLPANISIGTMGDEGLICGARPWCGDGTISSADPADETQDSRQPHPPGDCSLSARQGIGSEDEPIEITLSEGGANNLDCWELCETDVEDVDTGQGCSTLSANAIDSVTETSSGVYEIVLERPISAGEWTTITYLGDDSYVAYASLPADANADEYAGPSDITALINYLNEVAEPPFGDYSCDMDHSTVCGPPDITRLIDLRNGSSKFIAWSSKTLPSNTCP